MRTGMGMAMVHVMGKGMGAGVGTRLEWNGMEWNHTNEWLHYAIPNK